MDSITKTLLQFIPVVLTGLVTYLIARKKNEADVRKVRAETTGQEIKNVEAIVQFWQKMSDDLTGEIIELKKELIEFIKENKELKKNVIERDKRIETLETKVANLEKNSTGQ